MGVGNLVSPAHHFTGIDCRVNRGILSLEVVSLWIEWIKTRSTPLHEWCSVSASSSEVDSPVLADGLVAGMAVQMLLLGHIDSCNFVLEPGIISPAVGSHNCTAGGSDSNLRSLCHSHFVSVKFDSHLSPWWLYWMSLDSSICKFCGVWGESWWITIDIMVHFIFDDLDCIYICNLGKCCDLFTHFFI